MKKLLLLIVVSIFSLNVYAHGGASAIRGVRWTPVNIVAFPIALFDPEETEVYGILFSPGMGMSAKNVYGVNLGIATLVTRKCYGVSINIISVLENNGLSLGLLSLYKNNGMAWGVCNLIVDNNGISLGGINLFENNAGVSIGIVNMMIAGGGKSNGVSIGVANISQNNILQLGIYNQAESGLQIGLLNHNPNALIPWMPIFNWSAQSSPEKTQKK